MRRPPQTNDQRRITLVRHPHATLVWRKYARKTAEARMGRPTLIEISCQGRCGLAHSRRIFV